jgi:glycosyltransferase involved in cell wall biosynthesis
MKIAIDFQFIQADYSSEPAQKSILPFVKSFIQNCGSHEIIISLSSLFPETIEKVRRDFQKLLSRKNIRVWYAPEPLIKKSLNDTYLPEAAEYIREGFLASLSIDFVLVIDSFTADTPGCLCTAGAFAKNYSTALLLCPPADRNDAARGAQKAPAIKNRTDLFSKADLVFLSSPVSWDDISEEIDIEKKRVIFLSKECTSEEEPRTSHEIDKIVTALESHLLKKKAESIPEKLVRHRPKLAYVSPMPPEQTGISEYSYELLPELSRYYDIDVIVSQEEVSDPWVNSNCSIKSDDWFLEHGSEYSRIIYQLGNSHFHNFMLPLLCRFPGLVVLHDFYLGDLQYYRGNKEISSPSWDKTLYLSHGYPALKEKSGSGHISNIVLKYPWNMEIFIDALGIIVHSEYSKNLASQWYGEKTLEKIFPIPHLRVPANKFDRLQARGKVGLDDSDFVICCFGLLGKKKQNLELFRAWLKSSLSSDPSCKLIFVGNARGEYGKRIQEEISQCGHINQVKITGWVDRETFKCYLSAADLAVQLRIQSRGESSGTVLDCMNFELPTILNANGSMAEIPGESVWKLEDEYEEASLIEAMEKLWRDEEKRKATGLLAKKYILNNHSPAYCASQYAEVMEQSHLKNEAGRNSLVSAIAQIDGLPHDKDSLAGIARCIALNQPDFRPVKTLFIDVSVTSRVDLKTGIERVSRALILELVNSAPTWLRIEPVYLFQQDGNWFYRCAKKYTMEILQIPGDPGGDELAEMHPGDILLVTDLATDMIISAGKTNLFRTIQDVGTDIYFTIHDLLPVIMPHHFPPGTHTKFELWLQTINRITNHFLCVSRNTAEDFKQWLNIQGEPGETAPEIDIKWSHHGSDIEASMPSTGVPPEAKLLLLELKLRPTFLMVGTIEPRKGHLQTILAFNHLWNNGMDVNLVIVGREGWKDQSADKRRTLPKIMETIQNHPELQKRFYWLDGISDEFLQKIYSSATCLIFASEGEGFGLPLIEAARHGLPLIVRNIPVFREVAGSHAFYFEGIQPESIATAIKNWLVLQEAGSHPVSHDIPWLTWKQSARNLLCMLLEQK